MRYAQSDMKRVHFNILFECEKFDLTMPGSSSRDKAYLKIRRGTKLLAGTLGLLWSRNGMLK